MTIECHGLDTPDTVFFYEQDFYVLSNFSSFAIKHDGILFPTAEHLYQFQKFARSCHPFSNSIASDILRSTSAHDAFAYAQKMKAYRREDWDEVKVPTMRLVLRQKVQQHEYVHRKLLATGDRQLVENSWRDDYWGWGRNRDGQNMLGKLWMELRGYLQAGGRLPLA